MNQMLIGAIVTASLIAGLFFFRFWRTSGDRFFLLFALSFWIEGLNRLVLGSGEDSPFFYLVRLVAYALIVLAILDKNRPRHNRGD
jgi:hypothetical protein